jgi:hypothetical protein
MSSGNTKNSSKNARNTNTYDLTASSYLQKSKLSSKPLQSQPKKLRSALLRSMSDRVLKITQCSQQQNVKKTVLPTATSTVGSSTGSLPTQTPLPPQPLLPNNNNSCNDSSIQIDDENRPPNEASENQKKIVIQPAGT